MLLHLSHSTSRAPQSFIHNIASLPLTDCFVLSHDACSLSYHIPTIHPGLNKEVDMRSYRVAVLPGMVEHITDTTADSAYDGLWVWQYPTLAINWYGPGLR